MRKVIFCGGDRREISVMKALQEKNYQVEAYGYPLDILPGSITVVEDIQASLAAADVCILPQPPIKKDGQLHSLCAEPVYLTADDLSFLPQDTPILCGVASLYLRTNANQCQIFELTDDDRMAVPLAPASAEGAIAEAISLSDSLLCGSKALILGFGRIGREVAWRLEGLGLEVTVMNRGVERRTEAEEMGYTVVERSHLVAACLDADYIFNTAPAMLLDEIIIGLLRRETCIIDLAAYPGGTDFIAAARRGIKAIHAGGMPGKYAPTYAGMVMAEFYPAFIDSLLTGEGE